MPTCEHLFIFYAHTYEFLRLQLPAGLAFIAGTTAVEVAEWSGGNSQRRTVCLLTGTAQPWELPCCTCRVQLMVLPFFLSIFLNLFFVVRALGRPGTHHTYDDARLLSRGIELGLPDDTGLLEYTVVKDMTGLVV